MTTINGKEIPARYRSIENLPKMIDEMEWYGDCSDRNGNLDKNEALCVMNYVGDEIITIDDYQLAQTQSGLSSFINMTPRQFRDLSRYFGETFEDFLPYVEYQDGDGSLVSRKGISISGENSPELRKKIDALSATFVDEIWPQSRKEFYYNELEPFINQLPKEERIKLFEKLNELDPAVVEGGLIMNVNNILHQYQIQITIIMVQDKDSDQLTYYWVNQ